MGAMLLLTLACCWCMCCRSDWSVDPAIQ